MNLTALRRACSAAAALLGLLVATPAAAAVDKTLCVYDPSGAAGPTFQNAKAYQAQALQWGVNFSLKPYTDESVAAADFRNAQCDAALITGVRVQQFNRKSYSLEALGLAPTASVLKTALQVLAKPKAAALMTSGAFETAAIYPAGEVLLFVNDRSMQDTSALAGKRVCTMDFDDAAKTMVAVVGAHPVPADIGTFASKFNNGSCDVAYAPAAAYKPLELHKGVGAKGGVVDFPVTQMTLQLLIRTADFPAGFGQQSREWSAGQFDSIQAVLAKIRKDVPAASWIQVEGDKKARYNKMLADTRAKLVASGSYDATVVKLVEQIAAQ